MTELTIKLELDEELRDRIESSAAERNESVQEWAYRAILRELKPGKSRLQQAADEGLIRLSETGQKPGGRRYEAPCLRGERTVADTVIEDRR